MGIVQHQGFGGEIDEFLREAGSVRGGTSGRGWLVLQIPPLFPPEIYSYVDRERLKHCVSSYRRRRV